MATCQHTPPPPVIENGRAAVETIEEAVTFIGEAIKGLASVAMEVNLPAGDDDAKDSINALLTRVSFTEDVFEKYAADVARGVQMIPRDHARHHVEPTAHLSLTVFHTDHIQTSLEQIMRATSLLGDLEAELLGPCKKDLEAGRLAFLSDAINKHVDVAWEALRHAGAAT